ncbi:hypothetical protein MFUM_1040001 [Methylacidiphilum fumariolicum SolV]|uniref:Uncharacterized protein n=2 Tax=Candidatus Methylacidiphilum fumarolicum TaxID=591154 RepID=I0JW16_METFB|nr:conserved protein of unknown function [Candidatus Methylacidiphilum fumarolicum]CCG91435.1 hypothetical protein MFUM_1040001 [Methylacidiphilum fumariolicum SolV]
MPWNAFCLERSHVYGDPQEISTESLRNVRRELRLVFICRSISAFPFPNEAARFFFPQVMLSDASCFIPQTLSPISFRDHL